MLAPIALAICSALLGGCVLGEPPSTVAALDRPASFTVVATGDVLLHQGGPLVNAAAAAGRATGTDYDFSGVFAEVAPLVGGADLAICHLETPLAGPEGPFTGYPTFEVQPQIVDALGRAGYDICSTASNHSLDAGFRGLVRTLDTLDARGVGHSGTFRTEAESRTPHIVDVGGARVAHIAWTFGLNGIAEPERRPWAVNDFDPTEPRVEGILADAARARAAGADLVIASVHCCTEYNSHPEAAQVAIAHALLASPHVDLVLGHHAHVVQPFERIHGKWVAYGLGNHVAQQNGVATSDSVIARFTFTRGPDGRFTATTAESIPTRIQRRDGGVAVVLTSPGDASYERVAEVVGQRGARHAGLIVAGR